jgi:hypothetical protein
MGNIYHEWNGTVLTITSDSGTSSMNLIGEKGDTGIRGPQGPAGDVVGIQGPQGEPGIDGKDFTYADFTPEQLEALRGADGEPGKDGKDGADGYTPIKGTDYFTEADQNEIIQKVIALLGGTPVFGVVDNANNIILSGALESGTYTLKYEYANGSVIVIGTLEHTGEPSTPDVPDVPDIPDTPTYTNLFVANTATLNTRMSGSSQTAKAQDGYVMTAAITLPAPITMDTTYDDTTPYIVVPSTMWTGSANVFGKQGGYYISFLDAGATPGTTIGNWTKVPLYNQFGKSETISELVVSLYVKASAITTADIQNIAIYYNEIPE